MAGLTVEPSRSAPLSTTGRPTANGTALGSDGRAWRRTVRLLRGRRTVGRPATTEGAVAVCETQAVQPTGTCDRRDHRFPCSSSGARLAHSSSRRPRPSASVPTINPAMSTIRMRGLFFIPFDPGSVPSSHVGRRSSVRPDRSMEESAPIACKPFNRGLRATSRPSTRRRSSRTRASRASVSRSIRPRRRHRGPDGRAHVRVHAQRSARAGGPARSGSA